MEKLKHKKKENAVYAASRALWKIRQKPTRRIGAVTRMLHYIKEIRATNKEMKGKSWYSFEKRSSIYLDIFRRNCTPLYDAWVNFWDTVWGFILSFFSDLASLGIDIANILITAGYYLHSIALYIGDWAADFLYWCEGRKRALLAVFTTVTLTTVVIVVFVSSISYYEYSYYGKKLGVTKSKRIVYDTIGVISKKLIENTGANVSLNVERDIEFKKVYSFNLSADSEEDILNTLTYMKDLQVDAFAISVDGVRKVILENEETARQMLADIRAQFAGEKEGVEYTDVHYEKPVSIDPVSVKLGDIWNSEDALSYLTTGRIKSVKHTVSDNESITEIAAQYGVSRAQLEAANPGVDLEALSPGMELALSEPNAVITVISSEIATYYEDIEYGKQYIDNGAIYQGEEEVKTPGVYGKNEVVASISRINGKAVSTKVLSTTKLSDPVPAVVYRGTKPIPERIGTGTFILPVRQYIFTSGRGWRWGRMHEGVDLASSAGTKIYAADGGIVTYSGWQNGLGYCVYIDHGGLLTTVYAHCSKLLVSVGDQIYQGQNIALMGSTGNSTGSHLHFEVIYNGEHRDPEDYLRF